MNLRQVNIALYKAEDLYADNLLTRFEYNRVKERILKHIEGNKDLSYDDEVNQVYRISSVTVR